MIFVKFYSEGTVLSSGITPLLTTIMRNERSKPQMLVCTDFRFPPPGGAVSLHGNGNSGGRSRIDSEDASSSRPRNVARARSMDAAEGVQEKEASSSKPSSKSSRRRRIEGDREDERFDDDGGFRASSFFPIQDGGSSSGGRSGRGRDRYPLRGGRVIVGDGDDDKEGNADVDGGRHGRRRSGSVAGASGSSSSTGVGLEGGEEIMVAADERVRREERAIVDRYYAKRPRRHRKPPPPARAPKRRRAPEPVQVIYQRFCLEKIGGGEVFAGGSYWRARRLLFFGSNGKWNVVCVRGAGGTLLMV